MPIFMDRHQVAGLTADSLAAGHQEDIKIQSHYGCNCFTYWFDEVKQTVFCLIEAPSREAVLDMHRASHGLVPNEIIQVEPANVSAFLGRLSDPKNVETEPIRESAFRAIMFTDMANSTDITNQLGDKLGFDLLRQHHAIIREALQEHDGREVDRAGDGFLSSFTSASKAVECAIAIQQAFQTYNETKPPAPIHVRIGLGAGEPVADGDALFGSTINLTARICARSQPKQILAAPVVRDLCTGKLITFREHGLAELKGFPEAVLLHEVTWQ